MAGRHFRPLFGTRAAMGHARSIPHFETKTRHDTRARASAETVSPDKLMVFSSPPGGEIDPKGALKNSLALSKGALATSDGEFIMALPVGPDGDVLTADSTQTLGIKWAPGGGGGGGTDTVVTFQPGGTPSGNVFTDFGLLCAHIVTVGKTTDRWTIQLDGSVAPSVGTVTIPTGTYPMPLSVTFVALSNPANPGYPTLDGDSVVFSPPPSEVYFINIPFIQFANTPPVPVMTSDASNSVLHAYYINTQTFGNTPVFAATNGGFVSIRMFGFSTFGLSLRHRRARRPAGVAAQAAPRRVAHLFAVINDPDGLREVDLSETTRKALRAAREQLLKPRAAPGRSRLALLRLPHRPRLPLGDGEGPSGHRRLSRPARAADQGTGHADGPVDLRAARSAALRADARCSPSRTRRSKRRAAHVVLRSGDAEAVHRRCEHQGQPARSQPAQQQERFRAVIERRDRGAVRRRPAVELGAPIRRDGVLLPRHRGASSRRSGRLAAALALEAARTAGAAFSLCETAGPQRASPRSCRWNSNARKRRCAARSCSPRSKLAAAKRRSGSAALDDDCPERVKPAQPLRGCA